MECSPEPYADSSLHTKSSRTSPNTYKSSVQSCVEDMQRRYKEQYKEFSAALSSYRKAKAQLMEIESLVAQELAAKGVDPADPELDVNTVFVIARKRKRLAKKQLQEKQRSREELEKEMGEGSMEIMGNAEKELELMFGADQNFYVECESENEIPNIPLAISQVFS
eukprot:TRINITY_DN546_c0_g1_i6.p1 TRINITY_DN546_c0_g1~~TRINITY_DN546_c0_g1_i6.p1  ORF type:complete len:166 (-),score=50.69 TRINITY_DN546_c0_g1_i6:177-674(-)